MRNPTLAVALMVVLNIASTLPCQADDAEAKLVVTAIEPTEGTVGTKVKIAGRGFRGTKKVLFDVGYVKCKEARFQVISDTELQVEAPEYLTTDKQAAIIIQTPAGVTVTMPPEMRTVSEPTTIRGDKFMLVQEGGTIDHAGKQVTFIENQGVVSTSGYVTLVAKGGRLDDVSTFDPLATTRLVFHENGAIIADKAKSRATVVQVPHVHYSSVDKLFAYVSEKEIPPAHSGLTGPAAKQDLAAGNKAPDISEIAPNRGAAGDIVEIHGKGFEGTRSVVFFQMGEPHESSFRIKSDKLLRIEVPHLRFYDSRNLGGFFDVIVIVDSPGGVAFTMSRGTKPITTPNAEKGGGGTITWIGKGGSYSSGGGGQIMLVDDGGIYVRGGGGGCMSFLKNGATMLDGGGNVYCEPKAKLGDKVRNRPNIVEVPRINASIVDSYFNGQGNRRF